ncbi:GNAT family N-acetyltransferase [Liquorilactobacillus sicerae]|uniref:GNAT family N-acetyltransferase n=1 Tax=Liquorilactobacillus sicerae TaxID=1416943 RepID=UPI00248087CC|nr:GNAT family N-acetyltransferase [Liquorilactobacillus sicerae]
MAIYIRQAKKEDLNTIYSLIQSGKKVLAQEGIPQWQGNYPQKEDILQDINQEYGYLLIKNGQIVGTATLFQRSDPNYQQIYAGNWQGNLGQYATIHRITINPTVSGQHLGDYFFSNLISEAYRLGFREVRIDTHEKNQRMQHLVLKAGFEYAGIVYMHQDPNDQRKAFQLFLK